MEKGAVLKLISYKDGPIQVWKQGRDENKQQDYYSMEIWQKRI